jgi:hypothetical protein
MIEPGLDLHEWETRWQELQDAAAGAPAETLPEVVGFVRQMLLERDFQLDEPVTAEGDDADIVWDFVGASEIAEAAERGELEREDVLVALDDLREIYDFLVADRAPP